jgi:hypothetical protein
MLGAFSGNMIADKLDEIFWEGDLDLNLLRTVYLLHLIRSVHLKKHLEHVLNAQISLMYRLKYRMKLLQYKDDLPFEMTEEFMSRFGDSNKMPQPFDFLKQT